MKIVFLCSILLLILSACEKNGGFMGEGKITGADPRMCACCGGYFIQIEDSTYRFDKWPEDFVFNFETDTFPIYVLLDWEIDSILCLGDEINVSRMQRKD